MSLVKREEVSGGLHLLRLDDPEHHNVLSQAALADLSAALADAARDESVRVLAVMGNGRTFCTGADLAEIERLGPNEAAVFSLRGQAVLEQLARFPQPTLAAINGLALGGGLELALACDIRWAHQRAFMGFPEIKHGLCPAWGGVARLEQLVPRTHATELLLRGTPLSAAKARDVGLVSRVFDGPDFWDAVRAAAGPLLAGAAPLLRSYKALLSGQQRPERCFATLWEARHRHRTRPAPGELQLDPTAKE